MNNLPDAPQPPQPRSVTSAVLRGATSFLSFHAIGVGTLFATQLLLVRVLGTEQYGKYIFPLTCINLLVMLAKLGMDTASLRLLAAYRSCGQWKLFRGYVRRSQQLTLGVSVLLAVITALVGLGLREWIDVELGRAFVVSSLLLPMKVFIELRLSSFRALKLMALSKAPQAVAMPLLLIVGVFALDALSEQQPTATMALLVHCGAAALTVVFSAVIWHAVVPHEAASAQPEYQTREWIGVSLPLALTSSFNWIIRQSDIVMIGSFLGAERAAVYAVATRCVKLCGTGLTAVNAIAAPVIAELSAQNDKRQLQRMVTTATRAIYALSLPICLAMIVWGREVLGIFGPEFIDGYTALVILTVGQVFHSVAGTTGFLMTMTGHQRRAAQVLGGSAVLNVALNAILIPRYGLVGGSVATAVTTLAWTIWLYIEMKQRVGVSVRPYLLRRRPEFLDHEETATVPDLLSPLHEIRTSAEASTAATVTSEAVSRRLAG